MKHEEVMPGVWMFEFVGTEEERQEKHNDFLRWYAMFEQLYKQYKERDVA